MDEISRDVRSKRRFFFFFKERWFPGRSRLTAEQCTGSPAAARTLPARLPSDTVLDRRLRRCENPLPRLTPPRSGHLSTRPAASPSDDDTRRPRRSHVLLAGDLRSPDAAVRVLSER